MKNLPPTFQLEDGRQPALSRETQFKIPDDWVALGSSLQPPGSATGRVVTVRIGIDFGTAYTKVALRIADKVYFVSWSGTRQSDATHLLPGELSQLDDDSVWLGRSAAALRVLAGLKLPFLGEHVSNLGQQGAAVAFLSLVLRYTRAWLYRMHPALVSGRRLVWHLNVGCPTNSWSSSTTRRVYEDLAARAWQLSQTGGVIHLSQAAALLTSSPASVEDIGLDSLHLMPEFIAQIAGYVRSPQRRDGLHLLMDVGAGTLDLATFNVVRDGVREEDRYPIFASKVVPLGTHFLMAARLQGVAGIVAEWDDLTAIPSVGELAAILNLDCRLLQRADEEFAMQVRSEIARTLHYTRTIRYGKAPEWREGLPVFLSGGGASCDMYGTALASSCSICKVPYLRTTFPLLEEAVASKEFETCPFHRLSVAYGLTFDAEAVGRILAPHEIEDAPAFDPKVDVRRERPDRDDLYPK